MSKETSKDKVESEDRQRTPCNYRKEINNTWVSKNKHEYDNRLYNDSKPHKTLDVDNK